MKTNTSKEESKEDISSLLDEMQIQENNNESKIPFDIEESAIKQNITINNDNSLSSAIENIKTLEYIQNPSSTSEKLNIFNTSIQAQIENTNQENQLQSANSNLYSAFSQSLSSQSQQLSILTKKQLNLSIINFFNQNIHNNTSNSNYYSVIEKTSKAPYKEYEISYINSNGESTVKSYRRFDDFLDFHQKIKLKYPYIIIPSLPKKASIPKLINKQNISYYFKRQVQLTIYVNFISNNPQLNSSEEFNKLINDGYFDNEYFTIKQSDNILPSFNTSTFDYFKKKFYSYFTFLSSNQREVTEKEKYLKQLNTHFNNVLNNYKQMLNLINGYFQQIENENKEYGTLSQLLLNLRENYDNNSTISECSTYCSYLFQNNNTNEIKSNEIENIMEGCISILEGIVFSLEQYINLLDRIENVIYWESLSRKGKIENNNLLKIEYEKCLQIQKIMEDSIIKQGNSFIKIFEVCSEKIFMNLSEIIKGN